MNKLYYILMLLFIALPLNLFAEQRFYGIYSNMVSSGSEPSGFELFFLHDGRPGKCSDSVLFQFSEGWPQYPELLDCCGCSANHIEFVSKEWGKFKGKIENETLKGELVSLFSNIVFAQHEIDPETWIEMRKMIRHKGRTPSIEEDVAALVGPDAKSAGPRLIDRGPEALPAIHSALISDGVTLRHAQVLLQVIRSIGDKSSVPVVLEFLKRDTNNPLRRDALLVLALLPATEEAAAFIIELANNTNEKWHTYRMAFTWFGFHRDQRGRPYSQALLANPDPEKRAAGLFVLACLGDKSVLKPISQLLTAPPANSRDALLYALAELTTPKEFQRLAPSSLAWSNGYKASLLYTQYIAAGPKEKIPLCLKMLRSQRAELRRLAVRYLLDNGHANDLRPYAAVDLEAPGRAALIRNEIRKAGWRIIDTDEEFTIKQTAP